VERILAERGGRRRRQYLVKWVGYPAWEATWEAEENLEGAQEKMSQFRRRVEEVEEERMVEIMGIFKGVESVTEHHGGKEIKGNHGVGEIKEKGEKGLEAENSLGLILGVGPSMESAFSQ
jgi:hypothetical protein